MNDSLPPSDTALKEESHILKDIRVVFHGTFDGLFRLALVNGLLTLVTGGVYTFWAKVEAIRYLSGHTLVADDRFMFHGTGRERFVAFLKVFGFFISLVIFLLVTLYFISVAAGLDYEKLVSSVAILGYILAILFFRPFVKYGKRRYFLGRSSWRNIRFRYTGTLGYTAVYYFSSVVFGILTLGLILPWITNSFREYEVGNSHFGSKSFTFRGKTSDYYKINIVGLCLTLVTFGLYIFAWLAARIRHNWSNIHIENTQLHCNLTAKECFIFCLKTIPLVIMTLGLAAPLVRMMEIRLIIDSIQIIGEVDLTEIRGKRDSGANAMAEGVEEFAEFADTIGDVFG